MVDHWRTIHWHAVENFLETRKGWTTPNASYQRLALGSREITVIKLKISAKLSFPLTMF